MDMNQLILFPIILIDSGILLVLGLEDSRSLELPVWAVILGSIPPFIIAFLSTQFRLFLLASIILYIILIVLLSWYGLVGLGDITVGVRIPVLFVLSQLTSSIVPPVVFLLTFLASWILYYLAKIRPYTCDRRILPPFGSTLVKIEHLDKKYFFPANLPIESDNKKIETEKRRLAESGKKCVKVHAAQPLIFVFAIAYAIAVIVAGVLILT